MLTCFNCGKTGHFARNCKETKGDGLLPLEADEEVCPFPTLEEATEMAKDKRYVVRNPILDKNSLSKDTSYKTGALPEDSEERENDNIESNEELVHNLEKLPLEANAVETDKCNTNCVSDKCDQGDTESAEEENEDEFDMEDFDEEAILAETLRLEEYVKKLDVKQYMDTVSIVKPFYNLKENDEIIGK